jgi:glycerol-3-phosphate acyltransferase PlsX
MGGDKAPGEIVRGALQAARQAAGTVLLVGIPERIREHVGEGLPPNVEIVAASEVVAMDEKPTEALRRKRDSSIAVCTELVRSGEAGAMVSAGNTGAVTASTLLAWRCLPGVQRPAIATPMPARGGQFVLLDAGASPDVEPSSMVEFAHMGRAYVESVWDVHDAKVHLLNIGEEPGKGNQFSKEAYALLEPFPWFAGNVEGKALFDGHCQVVVCDAFVGNVVLKTAQGVAEHVFQEIRSFVPEGPARLLYAPLQRLIAPLKKKMDYAEYGGSPLLGLNGLCLICHGRSNARAIQRAVEVAFRAIGHDIVASLGSSLAQPVRSEA